MEHGIAGWKRRVAAPAGDGTHLVIGHDGMKLLPLDAGPGMVVLTFIQRDEVIRRGALGEVMSGLSNLQRSVSHLNWGYYLGFDEAGHYAIETVEGRRLAFEVTSGRMVAAR